MASAVAFCYRWLPFDYRLGRDIRLIGAAIRGELSSVVDAHIRLFCRVGGVAKAPVPAVVQPVTKRERRGRGGRPGPHAGLWLGARLEIEQLAAGHAGWCGAMIGAMGSAVGAGAVAGGAAGRGAGDVVARPRLVGRLAAQARVSVVSAPPGSGKTVLLRSWISGAGVAGRAAWVPAGRGERDPQRFWLSVLAALRQTAAGSALVGELTAAPDLDGWVITERLLTDLAPLDDRVWLVIDDVHELGAGALRQLELLIMRAPPGLRFVLAARHDVRLGLHRLRLEGELAEIREPDLRFTVAEAAELFAAAGVDLPDPALLVERTEGWAAGLRLAALSLAGHRTGAAGGRILRHRADGGRIPAGRGAGPAARAGAAAAAAHLHPGPGQRGAGRPADRR